uniref:Ig-like domain-containing protein n=1 Tax=Pygocentrus nattereri TaxID=42514 RepID=A0A3B4EKC1_PYGNA
LISFVHSITVPMLMDEGNVVFSLTIDCKVSYSVTSDRTAWIRQPAGKALEWINLIYFDGDTRAKDSLKSKFRISRDTGTNTITLRGQNLQTEDTAVYYCVFACLNDLRSYVVWSKSSW